MNIRLLGSSAAEGFPAIFCKCTHCQKARQLGGENIRTRTSAIIDDTLKIDFPPDTYLHVLRDGEEMTAFEHLFVTHTHHDHFYPEDIAMRAPIFAHDFGNTLTIYGNKRVVDICEETLGTQSQYFKFILLEAFTTYQIEDFYITPLPADHKPDEKCFIYFIEKGGKTCLYGHDTGIFPEDSFRWLEKQKIDLAILDCTNGLLDETKNHMNIEAVKAIKSRFEKACVLNEKSRIIATHFSHNIGLMHDDLKALLVPHGIEVAFDGMGINL